MDYSFFLDKNKEEMIKTLQESVRIKSVLEDEAKLPDGTILPFGKGIEKAYQHMLNKGKEMGFEIYDADHFGGHIEFQAEDTDEVFGIAAHLDVVPEGTGWEKEPYSADIVDNFMYGRGTTDDKGPLVACLYAMKALKEAGLKPKKNIRLILGLDEETEKKGMEYYLEKAGMPDFGITPDGEFPLANGEMGILIFDIAKKLKKGNGEGFILKKIESGTAPNIVPGNAYALIGHKDKSQIEKLIEIVNVYKEKSGYNVNASKKGTSLGIEVIGKAAHGAHPDLGLNSISILMELLANVNFDSEDVNEFIRYYNEYIAFDIKGGKLGIGFSDEPSGDLIFNVGMANFNDEVASFTINIRYPVTIDGEDVYAGIEKTIKDKNIGIVKNSHEKPVYVPEDDDFVKTLMECYREGAGDMEGRPFVMAGGTYAKLMNKVLAYGAMFPYEEDRMHQANERLDIDSFTKFTKIYADMLYKLCF